MSVKTDDLVKVLEDIFEACLPATAMDYNDLKVRARAKNLIEFFRTQPPQDGWKSMESAPRDGTRVLAWCKDWYAPLSVQFYNDIIGFSHYEHGLRFQPTHWQPLPAPPQPAKTDGDKL